MNSFKILFLTQEDPFYVKIFFEQFFKNYPDINSILAVVISKTMGDSTQKLFKRTLSFYGPKDFIRMMGRYSAVKINGILSDALSLRKGYSVKQVCSKYNIKVILEDNINGKDFLDQLRKMAPDLIISVACPRILKKDILSIPQKGCINIHHAPLPRYKGMMPNFWQMYHGEKSVGITIHKMNEAIDEGEIIFQKLFSIMEGESLDALIKRTKRIGADCMIDVIKKIRENNYTAIPNRKEESSYFTFPSREDVQVFRQKGNRVL